MIVFIGDPEKRILVKDIESVIYMDDTNIGKPLERLKLARHYDAFLFDLSWFENNEEEMKNALYMLSMMNHTRIIILAQEFQPDDDLIVSLKSIGLSYFVFSIDNAEAQIADCLKGKQPTEATDSMVSNPKIDLKHKNKATNIGIAGVYPRMGVTTQAFKLLSYLILTKKSVAYLEYNDSGHAEIIKKVFAGTSNKANGSFLYHNIPIYPLGVEIETDYDYIIKDFGIDSMDAEFLNCDKKILLCGSAAWEMAALAEYINSDISIQNISFLFNFTDPKEQKDIQEFMKEKWSSTFFTEYSPDMFSDLTKEEIRLYHSIVFPKLVFKSGVY